MAFLAPALRWPDAFGVRATSSIASIQPHLPAPLSELSPDVLLSIFVSLLFLVLIAAASAPLRRTPGSSAPIAAGTASHKRARARETPNVVLVGPSGVGKTSLFSALAFDSVPSMHPSQQGSETVLSISTAGVNELKQPKTRNIHLIDTPGHPRIKDRIIAEHIKDVDVLVFCVDAKEALRGSNSAGQAKEGSIVETVDHLHAALTQLAKSRRNVKTRPPTLLFLFTRADLSPHLANVSLSSTTAEDVKRQSILLARAQATVEAELARRRAGMGLGAKRTTKVGGMSKVTGGENAAGVWNTLATLLGWRRATAKTLTEEKEDEEETEEDYVVEKPAEQAGAAPASNLVSLNKLNENIVFGGSATFAFAMIGTERGWSERPLDGLQELKRKLMDV